MFVFFGVKFRVFSVKKDIIKFLGDLLDELEYIESFFLELKWLSIVVFIVYDLLFIRCVRDELCVLWMGFIYILEV